MSRRSWLISLAALAIATVAVLAWFPWHAGDDTPGTPQVPATAPPLQSPATAPANGRDPLREAEAVRVAATPDQASPVVDRMAAYPQGLKGLIVDGQSQPLPGAQVFLLESARNEHLALPVLLQQGLLMGPVAETRSAADGTFALGLQLANDKLYELRLLSPKHADVRIGDLRVLPDEWHDVGTLVMAPGATVRGHVTIEGTATPVPHAMVTIAASTAFEDAMLQGIPGRELGLSTMARTDGTYEIRNAPARGVVQIHAAAPGFARVIKKNIDLSANEVVEVHFGLPAGVSIAGTITDATNQPIFRARIEAWPTKASLAACTAQSQADGSFEIVGLREGPHLLKVIARGYQDVSLPEVTPGTHQQVRMRMRAKMLVRVTTPEGQTLRNYQLGVRRHFAGADAAPDQIARVLDVPDQRVRLDGMTNAAEVQGIPTGQFVIQVAADGYAKTLSDPFAVQDDTTTGSVLVVMTIGGTLRGRVADEAGRPLAGATVTTSINGARPDNPLWRMLGRAAADQITVLTATTDATGDFVLPRLAFADYQLEIQHPEACRKLVCDLSVKAAVTHELGTIRLTAGALVFGRATVEGRVAGQMKVVLTSVSAADAPPTLTADAVRLETVTDSAGAFRMARLVPPGDYEIRAVAVATGDPDAEIFAHLLQMARPPQTLTIAPGQRQVEQQINITPAR